MLGFLTLFYNLGLNDSCSICACRYYYCTGLLSVLAGQSVQKSLPEVGVRVLELSWGYDFSWLFLHLHTPVSFSHQIRSVPIMGAGHTFPLKAFGDYRDSVNIYKSLTKPELEVEVVSELLAALGMECNLKYFRSVFYPMEKSHGLVPLWNVQWIH